MHRLLIVTTIVAGFVVTAGHAATERRSAFDRVATGTIIVYSLEDLTRGRQDAADEVAKLIQETVKPDGWKGEWRSAALRATPQRLTVKASSTTHAEVLRMLDQLREARNLFIRLDCQLVIANVTASETQKDVVLDARQSADFKVAGAAVARAQVTGQNGEQVTVLDGTELSLPT